MRRLPAAIAAVLLSLTLASCGDGGDNPVADDTSSSGPTDATPSDEPSEEPSEETATIEQYASIVARNSDVREDLDKLNDCDWLGTGPLDFEAGSMVCQLGLFGMTLTADTLALSLEGAAKEGVPAYIGAPPEEISDLVDETIAAARELRDAATAADGAGCAQKGTGRCLSLRVDTSTAMRSLSQTLDAWGPYL